MGKEDILTKHKPAWEALSSEFWELFPLECPDIIKIYNFHDNFDGAKLRSMRKIYHDLQSF